MERDVTTQQDFVLYKCGLLLLNLSWHPYTSLASRIYFFLLRTKMQKHDEGSLSQIFKEGFLSDPFHDLNRKSNNISGLGGLPTKSVVLHQCAPSILLRFEIPAADTPYHP